MGFALSHRNASSLALSGRPLRSGLPSAVSASLALLALLQQQFALSPPAIALCGFALPLPGYVFGLKFLSLVQFMPFKLKLMLGLNCALNNPLDVSAGVDFGGGR